MTTLVQQLLKINPGVKGLNNGHPDFSSVPPRWLSASMPVEVLAQKVTEQSAECVDLLIDPSDLRLQSDGTISHSDGALTLSRQAARQLCKWAGISSTCVADFLLPGDDEGKDIFSRAVNRGMENLHNDRFEDFMLRLRGSEVRAVFSDRYGVIDNDWVTNLLAEMVPGGRVTRQRFNGDTVSGLLLIPETIREEKDSGYGGAFHFRNCEVGTNRFYICPSVFRLTCLNGAHFSFGEAFFSRNHSGNISLPILAEKINVTLQKQIPLTVNAIDRMLESKDIRLAQGSITALRFIATYGKNALTQGQRQAWAEGYLTEGADSNAFGVVQGLTRASQEFPDEQSLEADALAGQLLTQPASWWAKQERSLERFDVEDVAQILGEEVLSAAGL